MFGEHTHKKESTVPGRARKGKRKEVGSQRSEYQTHRGAYLRVRWSKGNKRTLEKTLA